MSCVYSYSRLQSENIKRRNMAEKCAKVLHRPNHPLNVIKQLSASIEKGISSHSCDEKIFKESAIFYEDMKIK